MFDCYLLITTSGIARSYTLHIGKFWIALLVAVILLHFHVFG